MAIRPSQGCKQHRHNSSYIHIQISASPLLMERYNHVIHVIFILLNWLSETSGNCGAQQYYCRPEYSSETWVPACENLHKSTRFLIQCRVQECLKQVHLFMASWGPLAAELRRCETPLHPLTLVVKHRGKSNALHSHASTPHHMFLSDVKQGDKRLTYLINSPTQSSINISQMSPNWFAVPLSEHGFQKLQSEITSVICAGKFR